ncbi:MAG: alkaline phosphatase [Burkholderiales bacterium]|nr:alkaline phosphatase [Burkholderiales bacterium]
MGPTRLATQFRPAEAPLAAANTNRSRRALLQGMAAAAFALALAGCAGTGQPGDAAGAPRNIIILFADGTATTQWDFGRHTSEVLRSEPFATTGTVFREGTVGLLSTSPHDAYVTDSAAAASAMSTGVKVVNGALSLAPDGKMLRTAMQAAKASGKAIGLVTTATVYDATPAAFAVNARSRRDYQWLVDEYLSLAPEVLMGGGADFFLPQGVPGGKRKDGKDVIAAFRAKGYQLARNTADLKSATGPRLLGLFADEDMDFELDRNPAAQPTTAEMAAAALRALSQASPNGFVLRW